jgi:hypothetical protein
MSVSLSPAQIAAQIAALLAAVASEPTAEVGIATAGRVEVPSDLVVEVVAARAAEAKVKAAKERSEARLKAYMGDAVEATVEGVVVFSYAPGVRSTFDTVAFKASEPEIAAHYTRDVPVRPLLAKAKAIATLFGAA